MDDRFSGLVVCQDICRSISSKRTFETSIKRFYIAHMQANLASSINIKVLNDRAILALQGPKSGEVLSRLIPQSASMVFMDSRILSFDGIDCIVSRAGYTREDGFEISMLSAHAERLTRILLAESEV